MAKRKPLSKKVRFDVFKRDSFTCQYCGNKAPDFVLEIDHIKPVSRGGDNSIMNLVTSCFECNRGKSNRELKDNSIIEKQRQQIEELNIRRQQLEMMLSWRDGVKETENLQYNKAIEYFNNLWEENILTKVAEKSLIKLTKKYGIIKTLNSIDTCFEKYNYSGNEEAENFNIVFNKIGAVLNIQSKPEHIQQIAYIRGICKNKFNYFNDGYYYVFMNRFFENDGDLDDIIEKLKSNNWRNWSSFSNSINYYNDNKEGGQE